MGYCTSVIKLLQKRKFTVLLLIFLFPFMFSIFYYFKDIFLLYLFAKLFFPILVFVISFTLILNFFLKGNFYPYSFYLLFSMIFLDCLSAISSYLHFNQPLFLGITGQIKLLPFLFYFFTLYLLRRRKISLEEIKFAFLFWSFLSFITYIAMHFLLNPEMFDYKKYKFVVYDLQRGYRFVFPSFFIIFAVFYFYEKFFQEKKVIYLLLGFLFYSYLLFFLKIRFVFLGVFLTVFILTFIRSSLLTKFLSLSFLIITFMYLSKNIPYVKSILTLEDSSLGVRIFLTGPIILNFLKDDFVNLFLGAGFLNPLGGITWQDIFGKNFWPVDVGILGLIFEFGLIGVFVILFNYLIIIKEIRKIHYRRDPIIILAIKDYIIFLLLVFWWSSPIPYDVGKVMSLFAIIVYYNYFLKEGNSR